MTQRRLASPGSRPLTWASQAETVPQSACVPIYSDLVQRWASAGRTVPGSYDHEWAELMRRPPWPDSGGGYQVP
ncbi:hypothetical protein CD790_26720 [Streptomyces sp. SAJ15]|nr:hypothetical protein CD790_26720 [Streptomyces sp. SAJ15]